MGSTKKKTFKDYYQDPKFRERHKKYMVEKIKCECGCVRTRNNMSRHRKTNKHKKLMKEIKLQRIDRVEKELKKLTKQLSRMKLLAGEKDQQI